MELLSFFNEVGLFDVVDIGVMAFLIYTVLVAFKKTRAASVLIGILIAGGLYLLARQFNLLLTASVFQAFFAVILVAVVVIFQEELRHFFERVALVGWHRYFGQRPKTQLTSREAALLVRTLTDFAKEKIGALVVLRGKDMILRHLEGGEELQGTLSEALLKSLFDPHSPGHDGAVVIDGNSLARFGCHLPLSKNFRLIGQGGTRHAAALGLSELTDALCLVVSEEKGSISLARYGELHTISKAEELSKELEKFYQEVHPKPQPKSWRDLLRKNLKEKGMALGIACLLWFLHVHGSKIVYRSFLLPVEYPQLPAPLKLVTLEPGEVAVTFSGPRRLFYFLPREKIHLWLKSWQALEGTRTLKITAADIEVPKDFAIANIEPKRVRVQIEKGIEERKQNQ